MREFYNMDCMEGMKDYPDNFFDLAIVDPPYGAGFTEGGGCKGWFTKYHQSFANETRFGSKDSHFEKYKRNGIIGWDEAPPQEYFEELFRISKDQIIWGGITSSYRLQDAFLFGENSPYRRNSQWRWQNTHGRVLTITQRFLNTLRRTKSVSIPHKNL